MIRPLLLPRRLGLLALLAVLALALGLPARSAPAQAPFVLSGVVTNGTAGATRPATATVTGTEVDSGAQNVVAVTSTQMAADGTFKITGLPDKSGDRFAVSMDYNGVTYVAEAQPPTGVTLTVYETTTDDSTISVPSDTLTVFQSKANLYDVIQVMTIRNSADRTYIGKPPASGSGPNLALVLPVPKDISSFSANSGISTAGLSATSDGQVASGDPVVPGEEQISYIYEVPVAKSGWPASLPVNYPTGKVTVLVDPSLRVTGPGLTYSKLVPVSNQQYRQYDGGALAPGTALSADITPASSTSITLWIALFILLTVLLAGSLVVPRILRTRRAQAEAEDAEERRARTAEDWVSEPEEDLVEPPEAPAEGAASPPERQDLIEQIAALDEAHEAGTVTDEDHAAGRARLKEQLLSLESPAADTP